MKLTLLSVRIHCENTVRRCDSEGECFIINLLVYGDVSLLSILALQLFQHLKRPLQLAS